MSIEVGDIEGTPERPDFRRANGAPQIVDKDGKNQRFSRPSGWGKVLDDENALVNWKIDTAAKGVAADPSLQAEWVAVKDDDRASKGKLREKAIQAGRGNQASDTGTALHAMSERWEDPDDDFDPKGDFRKSLEAYSKGQKALGLVTERMEYQVANLEYRAAGTVDRLYSLSRDLVTPKGDVLPAGTLITGDLKTGKKLDFSLPGYHVQMAIYAQAEFYDVESDKFMPTPEINKDWGIIIHMPSNQPGVCEFLWCDLEVGNYGAYLVHEVRDWRRKWRNGTYESPVIEALSGTPEEMVTQAFDAEVVDYAEMMRPFIKQRIKTIRDNTDAANELAMTWPEGCPSPAQYTTDEQAEAILDLLDKIESKYGFMFPSGDPRGATSGHHDVYSITNKAPGVVQKEVQQ